MRKGTRRPYRQEPDDFEELFILYGSNALEKMLPAHWRSVRRWVDAHGGDELVFRRIRRCHLSGQTHTVGRILGQLRRQGKIALVARAEADMLAVVPEGR